MLAAGLAGSDKDDVLVYRRAGIQALWKALTESTRDLLALGPPGTGKSTLLWLYAAGRDRGRTLWVHFARIAGISYVVLAGGQMCSGSVPQENLGGLVEAVAADLVILDGLTADNQTQALAAGHVGKARVVGASSGQLKHGVEDTERCQFVEFPSWEFNEYVDACLETHFFDSVKSNLGPEEPPEDEDDLLSEAKSEPNDSVAASRLLLLTQKYFYAGGSARWMFRFGIDQVVADIEQFVATCVDLKAALAGTQGAKSVGASSHIFCSSGKVRHIVSQYATRTLAAKVDLEFVQMAVAQAAKWQNPSFAGWVLELEILVRLRTMLTVQEVGLSTSESWRTMSDGSSLVSFKDVSDLPLVLKDGDWLVPSRWNQGSYDLAQLMPDELRVVQITCAKKKQTLKAKYIRQLCAALITRGRLIKLIHICYVIPPGATLQFKQQGRHGHLPDCDSKCYVLAR